MEENKGKCFSKVNQGKRLKGDMYQTPYLMTQALFDNEVFDDKGTMIEPACGKKAMVKIIKKNFKGKLTYYDLYSGKMDFLNETRSFDYLITNPPYSKANQFIMKAKQIIKHRFCLLLPLNYLQGQWRYENIYKFVEKYPLERIYVFTRMPMLSDTIRSDGKYKTGMQSYAWFIWVNVNTEWNQRPIIHWIDSKDHIYRGGKNNER